MGNTSSSNTNSGRATNSSSHSFSSTFSLKKSSGALGLCRSELDRRCKPSGLYPECTWDEKIIRKLIGDGRLAARVRGNDERDQSNEVECPICFLYYNQVNVTECCSAFCCTECFLQLKPLDGKKNSSDTSSTTSSNKGGSGKCNTKVAQAECDCPFCNAPRVAVRMSTNQANLSKIAEREEEEQRIIEAKIRANLHAQTMPTHFSRETNSLSEEISQDINLDKNPTTFGQSLCRMTSQGGKVVVKEGIFVASVEERQQIEDEMKQQHRHPLVRQLQEEAEAASNARAAAYARSVSELPQSRRNRIAGRNRSSLFTRSRSERDWNSMFDSTYGRDDFPSLDDLVVLEAAIMLSMEEEAMLRENGGSADASIAEGHSNGVREAFPFLHALMSRNLTAEESEEASSSDHEVESVTPRLRVSRGLTRMSSSRRRRRRHRPSAVVGGMSEEEQVAMAIALSLRDPPSSTGIVTSMTNQRDTNTGENIIPNISSAAQESHIALNASINGQSRAHDV